ncbi:MAG TPA: hypothetical protein VLF18_01595 [Tahibacter sp.]|uniref:hypothetical protein n=1 Tax=Tahibacter sp. TaxID=2056211 RepID=UPI002C3A3B97|nr:hypothetical protein [Tahibacter sp.]HSX58868.1 hypothetical protein [Tahibacter sp.]
MTAYWISFAARCALGLCAAAQVAAQDAADAADAAMKASRERAEADERAARTQLVSESRILFPRRAGKFELQRSARDPEPLNGAVMVYRYGGDLDTDFEIQVRPLGKMAEDEALSRGAQLAGSCLDINRGATAAGVPVVRLDPWTRRTIDLDDGRELQARQRICSTIVGHSTRVVRHTLIAYRDFYLIELHVTALASDARLAASLVSRAGNELFPRIHVQNIGNCAPPAKPKLVIVDEIDRGADRVSPDGAYLYATKKPGERELAKLLERAAERRRKTSCVISFSMASLLPDETFETLRFPAGSWTDVLPFAPSRAAERARQQ